MRKQTSIIQRTLLVSQFGTKRKTKTGTKTRTKTHQMTKTTLHLAPCVMDCTHWVVCLVASFDHPRYTRTCTLQEVKT